MDPRPFSIFRLAGMMIGLVAVLAFPSMVGAQIDSSDYLPLDPGNTWKYRVNGTRNLTTKVLPEKVNVQGVDTSVILYVEAGTKEYYTSDQDGIRLHRIFQPKASIPGYGTIDLTLTLIPPLVVAEGSIVEEDTFDSSGVARTNPLPYVGVVNFPYVASFTFDGPDNVTVPAGSFDVITISGTLTIYYQAQSQPEYQTFHFAQGLGLVKTIAEAAGQTVTMELVSTSAGYVRLLSPIGGEILPTGEPYDIRWDASNDADYFQLKYSVDNGVNWLPIPGANHVTDTHYLWTVPFLTANKGASRIMVIGYNAAGMKVETDISDGPFTIEVAQVSSPKAGDVWTTGETRTITWTTHATKAPVASVKLSYIRDGATTWIPIPAAITGNPERYDWVIPVPGKKPKTKCKVKVVLKDAKGLTLGSDTSDGFFTLQPLP
jgi:hypothetical protein